MIHMIPGLVPSQVLFMAWNHQCCESGLVFTFWFDRESIIPGNFGFAISVCRLRERGRMSRSVYVCVFHDLELLRYVLRCAIK